ncbi:Helix-turn-helix domain-containing protein [Lentzea albidocapillata]|uniref:Helix-turn-helix domain-containing protein n=1 Tax=Lentzea albidocapillata TaxID=40571 RepID=A0A1W2FQE2_9PSEU|nr:Helix-turn-helix domain-containing protein [Lentzea albidocapillata]
MLSDVVAERVKEVRARRSWSAQQLADRCAELGATQMTPSVIANIEAGRRGKDGRRRREITVDELFVLAEALGTSPTDLLVMPSVDATHPVTPNRQAPMQLVRAWLDMHMVPLDEVIEYWERMQGSDELAEDLRRRWYAEQDAYQRRVDGVRLLRESRAEG